MKFYHVSLFVVVLFAGCKPVAENSEDTGEVLTLQDRIMDRDAPDLDRPHPSVIRVYEN